MQGPTEEGKFFVRPRPGASADDKVITVVYKGRPTHHLCRGEAGPGGLRTFSVNGNNIPGATSLEEVVEHLRHKRSMWPVPLTRHVPRPGAAAEAAVRPPVPPTEHDQPKAEAPAAAAPGAPSSDDRQDEQVDQVDDTVAEARRM